jgi:hypothetical protein
MVKKAPRFYLYNKYVEVLMVHAVHRTFIRFPMDIIVTSLIKKRVYLLQGKHMGSTLKDGNRTFQLLVCIACAGHDYSRYKIYG